MATSSTINSAGVYVTRGGRLVFIVEINGDGIAQCHGYVVEGTRQNIIAEWAGWTQDGRLIGSSTEHEKDILRQI